MVMVRLTGKMGVEPILPIRRAITISTMIKLDGDWHGEGVGTCKHTLRKTLLCVILVFSNHTIQCI